jgi:hypothetical protein
MEEYVRSVMMLAGLDKDKMKCPVYKLSYSADFQTSVYLV